MFDIHHSYFRYDAYEVLCCFNNYYDPPLMAGYVQSAGFSPFLRDKSRTLNQAKSLLSDQIYFSSSELLIVSF